MTNSTGSGWHSTATATTGSGSSMRWLGTRGRASSNQWAAIWLSTWPFQGMVPSTTSKALNRSVTTMMRR